jgi:hypothetical protein
MGSSGHSSFKHPFACNGFIKQKSLGTKAIKPVNGGM